MTTNVEHIIVQSLISNISIQTAQDTDKGVRQDETEPLKNV